MHNKYLIGLLVVVFSLSLFGCDNFIVVTVLADEEAIIMQSGEIVGDPLGPGVHYIIPVLQKAHIIKKHMIRRFSFTHHTYKDINIILFWNVADSKKYFLFSRDKSNEEINSILKKNTEEVIGQYDRTIIEKIAMNQKRNPKYSNNEFSTIFDKAKYFFSKTGINLDLLIFHK